MRWGMLYSLSSKQADFCGCLDTMDANLRKKKPGGWICHPELRQSTEPFFVAFNKLCFPQKSPRGWVPLWIPWSGKPHFPANLWVGPLIFRAESIILWVFFLSNVPIKRVVPPTKSPCRPMIRGIATGNLCKVPDRTRQGVSTGLRHEQFRGQTRVLLVARIMVSATNRGM